MQASISVITLGVADLERAYAFYHDGLGWPSQGIIGREFEHGAVAFFKLGSGLKLALWPHASMAADSGLPLSAPGALACLLSHNLPSAAAVDQLMAEAQAAGATLTKPAQKTFWGGYAGYFQDPDGHLWEVVYNPDFEALG
ncbi:VOC family protein [Uliginosibacterium flavum]|uniref:VOC family protein n=1 Tax=Uliginosibacterium flavum TaxID=1396831 RepID=A0ABV2TH49_9RHOO